MNRRPLLLRSESSTNLHKLAGWLWHYGSQTLRRRSSCVLVISASTSVKNDSMSA